MTTPAADTLTSNSAASLGSIGSTQRIAMPALNPARARRRIAWRGDPLGGKALDSPGGAGAAVTQPVVQPVGASLPELDVLRQHAVAAPMRRPGRGVAEALFHLAHGGLQSFSSVHDIALLGGPRGQPRAQRTRGEIGIGFGAAHLL